MPHPSDNDTTRATASLPGLEIEIVHRRPRDGDVEALSINLQAMPSFEAFGRFLETANPFAFWAQVTVQVTVQVMEQAMQMTWLPWLGATRGLTAPWNASGLALTRPHGPHASETDAEPQRGGRAAR